MYVRDAPQKQLGDPKLGERVWWQDVIVTAVSLVVATVVVETFGLRKK